MNSVQLTAAGEEAWLRLKTHLEWSNGFALCFIFSAHPGVVGVFRERLSLMYRTRVTGLIGFVAKVPDDFTLKILPALLNPSLHDATIAAPAWLDCSYQSGDEWRTARLNFLARLNEQREKLRNNFGRPVIIVLPFAERERIRELVPDLWAIRDVTVDTDESFFAITAPPAPETKTEYGMMTHPLSESQRSIVAEWERIAASQKTDRGMLLAGERAFNVLISAGKIDKAGDVAGRMLEIAKKRMEGNETPESLRDVSISLDNVGNVSKSLGRLEEAQTAYTESLAIATILANTFPGNSEYAGLLSVFSDHLGELKKKRESGGDREQGR